MRDIALAIRYMPYPHTGDATLEKVIYEWELQDKVFCKNHMDQNQKKKSI
ncbi:hypothetical protein RirG_190150 [Rhizophagus irregularis DAOM 197198w]|uniref:Uncharacterized protein n=1 Tax=Rhizophagus irregularis (strain DAOM 197198w) TaxID=1432141 RepID=A0A015IY44_RHIIW|nr:hypothetical protein RirG_190150 [Rhizophagus irregularis DAOM 197198w]